VSPEFPSDNPELWQAHILYSEPESETEPESESEPEPEIEVEVVDFDDADFAAVENESIPPPAAPAATEDTFQVFVRTLVEVSLAAGAEARVAAVLPGMLGAARLDVHGLDASMLDTLVAADLLARTESGGVTRSESLVANAHAWRATLLGEETEFSASSMLDEWSAHIVSTLAAAPERKEALRRELRAYGIAAFGMIVEAA
jgi:hypothetical protein